MDLRIEPHRLSGAVTPPPSKSMAHRLIISAALGGGTSTIRNVAFSQDIEATLRCMEALGARWERLEEDTVRVTGIGQPSPENFSELPRFDCGESGSTLRFLIPIALAVAGGGVFTGHGRLMERPQKPYFDLFDQRGISHHQEAGVLTVQGRLTPGEYPLAGNVSSQFFTGLLFALPLLDGPSTVVSTTALESADYITMTINAMHSAGVTAAAQWGRRRFQVLPMAYQPFDGTVEADWSQAGFWYAANFLSNEVDIRGLNPQSAQGDMVVSDLYWKLAKPGEAEIDVSGCPDLLPPLAVMAAVRQGTTRFVGAARLRIKESDRLATTAALLNALGGQAEEGPDSLTVHGVSAFSGGTVDGANDHRIVMAAAIAATRSAAPVTILGAQAVRKSYPDFFEVYQSLGGAVHVL
nr:3-phosphoshikimate 1-carboxyvinyltransferase [uncultured Oscillibacter sp.]